MYCTALTVEFSIFWRWYDNSLWYVLWEKIKQQNFVISSMDIE